MQLGAHVAIAERVAAGEVLEEMLPEFPIAPVYYEASGLFQEALEIFERLGDRRGVMASIIAMGYLNWAADIHLGSSSARHIEEIRRLTSKAKAFTNESERAAFEAQMLYGVHVFARAKVIPDLALSRAEQAHAHAREMGDRSLEFLAAGGAAMAHLDMGEVDQAKPWLDRAAAIASMCGTCTMWCSVMNASHCLMRSAPNHGCWCRIGERIAFPSERSSST
jgi:tetratricopeptide (TPR) repeat protein